MHWLAHLFGWNTGKVVSAIDKHGWVWIAFQCDTCGKLSGKHPTKNVAKRLEGEDE